MFTTCCFVIINSVAPYTYKILQPIRQPQQHNCSLTFVQHKKKCHNMSLYCSGVALYAKVPLITQCFLGYIFITVVFLPADVFLSCQQNYMSPHCISLTVDKHAQVANQPNTIQLSRGNHKMSMLTKPIYYYQPCLGFFYKYRNGWFSVGECKGGEVTQVLGCTDISACINEQPWSTKNMLWFLSTENVGNLCRGSLFLSALFARFPYLHPCCSRSPHFHRPAGNRHSMLSRWLPERNESLTENENNE